MKISIGEEKKVKRGTNDADLCTADYNVADAGFVRNSELIIRCLLHNRLLKRTTSVHLPYYSKTTFLLVTRIFGGDTNIRW